MNKVELNNKIISMRNYVRQARVHMMHKLSRSISKLVEKKTGPPAVIEKCQRKAQRLRQEALMIKTFTHDTISKFALGEQKNLNEIIADANAPFQNKVLAKLSSHKIIAEQVKKFREEFPMWRVTVPLMLQQLGATVRKKKKKEVADKEMVNTSLTKEVNKGRETMSIKDAGEDIIRNKNEHSAVKKVKEVNGVKMKEFSETDTIKLKSISGDKDLISKNEKPSIIIPVPSGWTVTVNSKIDATDKSPVKVSSLKGAVFPKLVRDKHQKLTVVEATVESPENEKVINPKKNKTKKIQADNISSYEEKNVAEVRRFSDLLSEKHNQNENKGKVSQDKDIQKAVIENPFFLPSSDLLLEKHNENENNGNATQDKDVQKVVIENPFFLPAQDDKPETPTLGIPASEVKRHAPKPPQHPSGPNRAQRRLKLGISQKSRHNLQNHNQGRSAAVNKGPRDKLQPPKGKKGGTFQKFTTGTDGDVHPSWEAKRKLREQQVAVQFIGKKIKFDD